MIGFEGEVLYDATPLSGAPSTGSWTEVTGVRDVTPGASAFEVEAMDKSGDIEEVEVGKLHSTVTLTIKADAGAGLTALQTAFTTRAEIALAFMDRDYQEGGAYGIAGNWYVTEMPEAQALEGLDEITVTVRPSSYTATYEITIAMDNAISLVGADGEVKTFTGDNFGNREGKFWITDNATWGDETIKNQCTVSAWAHNSITVQCNMASFAGEGETAYAWVETAHGVVPATADSFTFTEA